MWSLIYSWHDEWHQGHSISVHRNLKGHITGHLKHSPGMDWMEVPGKGKQIEVSVSQAAQFEIALAQVAVGLELPAIEGLGGMWHELTIGSGSKYSVSLRWWCDLPPSWASALPIVQALQRLMAEHGAQPSLAADVPASAASPLQPGRG